MGKLKVLVVEDDPIHAAKAEMLLDELGYELLRIVDTAEEAVPVFLATKPDLILMDIQLSGVKDGIEVANKINQLNPIPIIFTTSFTDKETFERAKETNPYAYMIKPLKKEALQRNIELAVFNFAKSYLQDEIETDYFTGWSQNMMVQDSFFVKTSNCLEKVKHADVLWIEVTSNRYCEIKTESRSFTLRTTLKSLEGKLSPQQFVRVHRAYIVNIHKIESIHDRDMMLGIGENHIPMGTVYKQLVLERLNVL